MVVHHVHMAFRHEYKDFWMAHSLHYMVRAHAHIFPWNWNWIYWKIGSFKMQIAHLLSGLYAHWLLFSTYFPWVWNDFWDEELEKSNLLSRCAIKFNFKSRKIFFMCQKVFSRRLGIFEILTTIWRNIFSSSSWYSPFNIQCICVWQ